jgi:hypothetical protein
MNVPIPRARPYLHSIYTASSPDAQAEALARRRALQAELRAYQETVPARLSTRPALRTLAGRRILSSMRGRPRHDSR